MKNITLVLSIEEVNQILSLLGRLPFAEVNNTIAMIVNAAEKELIEGQQEPGVVEEAA